MNFVFESRPSDSPFVESIWRTQSEVEGSFISSANTHFGIVIVRYKGQTTLFVRGPETRATPAEAPADAEFLGIQFRLGTFMPHLPPRMVMDRQDFVLPEAAGDHKFWLDGSAWQFPDLENVDAFIEKLAHEGLLTRDPIVDDVVQGHAETLSLRSVQRRFLHATGLTPKGVQQIERAREALARLERGYSILDTAYELGYFDQSHLTNSLRRFMGQTPAQIVRRTE